MQANQDVRAAITNNGVKFWECAEKIGVSSSTFSVWMRHELPEKKKAAILAAIETIAAQRMEEQ